MIVDSVGPQNKLIRKPFGSRFRRQHYLIVSLKVAITSSLIGLAFFHYSFIYYPNNTASLSLEEIISTGLPTTISKIVPCKYDGNCPIGTICNTQKLVCESYLGRSSTTIDTKKNNNARFDNCVQSCLEELKIDEWYLQESIPKLQSSYVSDKGGCVLHYQRKKTTKKKVTATIEEWMQGRFRRVRRVDPIPNIKNDGDDSSTSSWIAYCSDPCKSNKDCPDGSECHGRKTSTNLDITTSPKSCHRSSSKTHHHHQEQQQQKQQDMYVISGADNQYFKGLKNLAASLRYWSPQRKLIVYNLGMTEGQISKVQSWSNVHGLHWKKGIPNHYPDHVRRNLKNYAWKPIIINETVHKYKSIFWLDAGATFVGPVEPIEEILHLRGVFLVHGQDDDMKHKSHPDTYRQLGYSKETFRGGPHCAGGIQGHVYPSPYIDTIVIPNAKCALKESCIAPKGSSLINHRFDQTSLSILAYDDLVQAPHYTEFLAASMGQLNRNLSKPSSRYIIWTARGSCRHYSGLGVLKR